MINFKNYPERRNVRVPYNRFRVKAFTGPKLSYNHLTNPHSTYVYFDKPEWNFNKKKREKYIKRILEKFNGKPVQDFFEFLNKRNIHGIENILSKRWWGYYEENATLFRM